MNAIILAAGMGTRMRPLTNEQPKCMIPVCGVPIIERQIQLLHETGIQEIVLISGYRAECLNYLVEKYPGVVIRPNFMYDTCNNIYSMYVAQDFFGDSYVIEGDVYIEENCFSPVGHETSTYISTYREIYTREWGLLIDETYHLQCVEVGNGSGYIMSGVSYWTESDARLIKKHLNELINGGGYEELFWDDVVLDVLPQLNVQVKPCNYLHELDTIRELQQLEAYLQIKYKQRDDKNAI